MNRRELFRFLPSALLALPSAVVAAETPQEPSPWVEWDCPARYGPEENWEDRKPCGTKFMAIRGAQPICPKCAVTLLSTREKSSGIEVK